MDGDTRHTEASHFTRLYRRFRPSFLSHLSHPNSLPSSSPPHPLLLTAVAPIRLLFQPFLTDEDAARLLRVSRATAHGLVRGFTFASHVFEPRDADHLWRMKALWTAYQLRPTRMCLPREMRLLEMGARESPLPSSLTVLALGELSDRRPSRQSIFGAEAAERLRCGLDLPWRDPLRQRGHSHLCWQLHSGRLWRDFHFVGVDGRLGRHLHPSLIPLNLRILQFGSSFDGPLDAVRHLTVLEYLDVGNCTQSLVGVLPPGLLHLVVGNHWNHPLPPGCLPPLLQCLRLGGGFNQRLVPRWGTQSGSLPSSLRVLELCPEMAQPLRPRVFPAALTHLRLFGVASFPVIPDLLPSSLVSLELCVHGTEPLPPGVLPISLRHLTIGPLFSQPLLVGSLPPNLEFLRLDDSEHRYRHHLPLGVIPPSIVALDLPLTPREMARTVVPAGVRWLRVRKSCQAVVEAWRLPLVTISWW